MASYQLHMGDCLETLRTLPDNSVDSIVTDPPYGLSKEPDMAEVLRHWLAGDDYQHKGGGFMGKTWDSFVPGPSVWRECLRVLKPGGHLLAFFGTRTQDMGTLAIRLAGFEIRDSIAWVYGSGFPKSMDVSKAIDKAAGVEREVVGSKDVGPDMRGGNFKSSDGRMIADITAPATDGAKQWEGWGTALKPALEPITVARKPLIGTVAANVLAHGTGALNIDGCRVAAEAGGRPLREVAALRDDVQYGGNALAGRVDGSLASSKAVGSTDMGRWPANLIHDGSDEVVACFPNAPGQQGPISSTAPSSKTSNVYGKMNREGEASANSDNLGAVGFKMKPGARRLDVGSAARFFYCAKASKRDRGEGNTHPTVKPTDLMAYLCRLVTPPGGVVLDPFMGSGSTGKAAIREGFKFIGCELSDEYLEIARARIEHELQLQIDALL